MLAFRQRLGDGMGDRRLDGADGAVGGRCGFIGRDQSAAAKEPDMNAWLRSVLLTVHVAAAAWAFAIPLAGAPALATTRASPEADAATRQINMAFSKAKETREFKAALLKRDTATLAMPLVRNGAPDDIGVAGQGGERFVTITITCCRKKPWGPVVVVIEV